MVVLFTVDTTSEDYGRLEVVTTWPDWSGSQWRNGVGLQICSPTMIRNFGCSEDPSGTTSNYDFPIYYWG